MKGQAYNPFLPLDVYIPDGEPHIFGDRIYLFGSHDKEGGDTFCELDYEFFSAPIDDLNNWSSKAMTANIICITALQATRVTEVTTGLSALLFATHPTVNMNISVM